MGEAILPPEDISIQRYFLAVTAGWGQGLVPMASRQVKAREAANTLPWTGQPSTAQRMRLRDPGIDVGC